MAGEGFTPDGLDLSRLQLPPRDGPVLRELYPRFGPELLRPLEDDCIRVQWSEMLSPEEYAQAATLLAEHPDTPLHVYYHNKAPFDLAWLEHFPTLRHFAMHVKHCEDLSGLEHLPTNLRSLEIGETSGKPLDLSILARFPELERLRITGHSKGIGVLAELTAMRDLMLRSVKVHDLELLAGMQDLRSLDIKLGGMRDISLLPRFEHLEYLEIWRTRGLEDVSAIGEVPSLESFFLQAMRRIRTLPDLGKLTRLRHVSLMTMRGITDLAPVASAPNLESLYVHDTGSLDVEAFRAFVGHPALKELKLGIGVAESAGVSELLGIELG